MDEESSRMNNDRLQSILDLRSPSSVAECFSRLSTINYYGVYLPFMKRILLILWQMIKSGKFVWTITHEQAWQNIKYLCSLQVKNFIFQPHLPLLLCVDSSAVERAMFLFQILPDQIDLRIITCKSKLLTEAARRKAPVSREADAVSDGIDLAEPYLMQSTALANYIFSDMASIQFVS